MRNNSRFIVLLLCVFFSLTGYKAYASDQQTFSIVLRGNPEAVAAPEQAIRVNPKIAVPEKRTEYSINMIKPNPNIDYKIVEITPDPSVNHDIIIIDPNAGERLDSPDRWLGRLLRKKPHKIPKNMLN